MIHMLFAGLIFQEYSDTVKKTGARVQDSGPMENSGPVSVIDRDPGPWTRSKES